MTEPHFKEGTTEKMESTQVALSLHGENSSLCFIEAVRQ